jgi:hypothetical protein
VGLTNDTFETTIGDVTVIVTGDTGPVHATWRLLIGGTEVDSAAAAGDFKLRGPLPDGSVVEAAIHQSMVGPTRVVVTHGGTEVLDSTGFVA